MDLESRLEYLAFRAFYFVMSRVPRALGLKIGAWIGSLLYVFALEPKRIAMINLGIAFPEMSNAERRRILRASCRNLGRAGAEFCQLNGMQIDDVPELIDIPDRKQWEEAVLQGRDKGLIIATGHFGNWELLAYAHGLLGHPVTLVHRPMRNQLFDRALMEVRIQAGTRPIPKRAAARDAIRTLKDGGILVIPSDQNQRGHEGVFVDLYGTPACTNPGAARLAMRTGARVLPVFLVRQGETGRHRMEILPPIEMVDTGDREQDILTNTQRVSDAVGETIRRYPEQWIWFHKRYRTRPDGEPEIYPKK